jgi:hypothetical protein
MLQVLRARIFFNKVEAVFRRYQSQPVDRVVQLINPILSGWVNYFAVGDSSECFEFTFAASTHQVKSSAKCRNAPCRALPPSPIGLPSGDSDCEIGPTAIVLDTTTMPISDNVPCQAVAARAPEKRPAE